MSDSETAHRIALSLPEVEDGSQPGRLSFRVRGKQFAWTYMERVVERKPRVPNIGVLAVRCPMEDKHALLRSQPGKFFTVPHYDGFPAVLVRLDKVDEAELRELLEVAWLCQAPKSLAGQLDRAG
jgi:hypothetical protein